MFKAVIKYFNKRSFSVIAQTYETNVFLEDVVLGNDVIFKCKIPSLVNDFVHVINWMDNDGDSYYPRIKKGKNIDGVVSKRSLTNTNRLLLICFH